MTASVATTQPTWASTATLAARRLAVVTAAGGLLGLLVGGVGGRLAMMLLAGLNPEVTGLQSDDDFTMGQFSAATFNLLFLATLLGVFGAGVYFVLRGLMIGPRWFQVLSISVGPAVVVGAEIVHTDGVDFTLDPPLLAIALFVLVPGIYAALLTLLAEHWLDPQSRFARLPGWAAMLPLALWLPIAPLLLVLVAVLAAFEAVRRTSRGSALLANPVWPNAARGLLTFVFALALLDLIQDTTIIA